MYRVHCEILQVEVNVAAYMVCLSEAQGAWENAAPGATLADKMDAKAVAAIAQLLVPQLTSANDPLLATAKMQARPSA